MTKRMLIDSTHAEETRVVVLDGNRLEDYDVETSTKLQLKGNIYLAKVVRVEPSLQAAFVEYGGNRHGFLAFGEIHPDYYQIPVADRQRLLEMQEAEAREDEEAEDRAAARDARGAGRPNGAAQPLEIAAPAVHGDAVEPEPVPDYVETAEPVRRDIEIAPAEAAAMFPDTGPANMDQQPAEAHDPAMPTTTDPAPDNAGPASDGADMALEAVEPAPADTAAASISLDDAAPFGAPGPGYGAGQDDLPADALIVPDAADNGIEPIADTGVAEPLPEQLGGETDAEESRPERAPPRFLRNYKIQEVIRRRQILLIQVVKEERGSKGAALTTYISLAGRFSVLMPNSPRGGGISRKITSASDRRRLKEVTAELDLPRGMGLIVRTAGANRPKPEIIRDCEYLLNQWDQIRELTMKSVAPALIYEEASLIKRAIRDVYSRDVDDILVDGEQGWRAARDFMRMLMPTHAKKVQLWKDPQPLFAKAQVEAQLDAMLVPTVQLKSGGYLVINQTEALVAIDVNSGRSTRERGIEETALRTNMEAAEEAARQLRLRDLAGLIVIDFIDMESRRNNAAVEKKLKDALKNDRARIQIGSISHFGLLEMSRQRLRPSLAETSFVVCQHCHGTGTVRSTESAALHVLREIEEEGAKRRAAEIIVHVAGSVALYILNHKRVRLAEVEQRFGMSVAFAADDALLPPNTRIDRVRAQAVSELPAPISQLAPPEPFEDPDEEVLEPAADDAALEAADPGDDDEADAPRPGETAEEGEQRRKRRRRRRRGGRREDGTAEASLDSPAVAAPDSPAVAAPDSPAVAAPDSPAVAASDSLAVEAADSPAVTPSDEAAAVPESAPAEFDAVLAVAEAVAETLPAEPVPDGEAEGSAPGEDGERSKRRGRRGGRRRRREPGEAPENAEATAEDEPEPTPAPAYAGPTPANPFGGSAAFDIFDAIEQAEQERALALAARAASMQAAPEAADEVGPAQPALIATEMTEVVPKTMADPVPDTPEPLPPESAVAEPTMAEPVVAESPASSEPLQALEPEPEPEPPQAPMVVPVLVGDAEPAEKKRGWWRR